VCDGKDDDCNGLKDDDDPHPSPDGAKYFADDDHDGWGTMARYACTDFGYGWADQLGDCRDDDRNVHPGATEMCDGKDDDCNNHVDDNAADATAYFVDGDHDDFGSDSTVLACSAQYGMSTTGGDCDDSRSSVHPGATEVCNGRDDNCNGVIDLDTPNLTEWLVDADHDGYGVDGTGIPACQAFDGRAAAGNDCNDHDRNINPGETEINGDHIDNNCDGNVDFPVPLTGGLISSDTTWGTGNGDLYAPDGNAVVESGVTLTIEPCTRILLGAGQTLQIEGTLIARGTPDCPMVFTSAATDPAPGDWERLFFTSSHVPGVVDADGNYVSGSVLEYVQVLYGGGVGGDIVTQGSGSPAMLNVEVAWSSSSGIQDGAQGLYVRDSSLHDNSGAGVSSNAPNNVAQLLDSTFERNGVGASLSGGCCGAGGTTLSGNRFAHNNGTGLSINGSYQEWTITDNRFVDNNGYGLWTRVVPGVYEHNWIAGNVNGLHVGYTGTHTVNANVFADNTGTAVATSEGGDFHFTNNVFVRNKVSFKSGSPAYSQITFGNDLFQAQTGTDPVVTFPSQQSTSGSYLNGSTLLGPLAGSVFFNVGYLAGSSQIDATGNYWDGMTLSDANGVVTDFLADASLAVAKLDPVADTPDPSNPISMPTDVVATRDGDVSTLTRNPGPETDIAGYRVYYGLDQDLWALAGTDATEGTSGFTVTDTKATLTGLGPNLPWKFAVTQVDADADGVTDIVEGHESWFATP